MSVSLGFIKGMKQQTEVTLPGTKESIAQQLAQHYVAKGYRVLAKNEGGEVTLDVSPDLLRRQVTLIGSWTFSAMGMLECARFVAERKLGLERIFSHRWRLEQADEAYRSFDTQSTGKGVFLL